MHQGDGPCPMWLPPVVPDPGRPGPKKLTPENGPHGKISLAIALIARFLGGMGRRRDRKGGGRLVPLPPFISANYAVLNCAPGVDREISSSASDISAAMSANNGVLR